MAEAKRIDGKAFAEGLRATLATQTAKLKEAHGIVPGLAAVLIGEDPASQVYVRNKEKQCVETGMNSVGRRLDATTTQEELLSVVAELNADPAVHGILVQLPLPDQIESRAVIETIDPAKDVDGFHPVNVGRLSSGEDCLVPCTPQGCMMLLEDTFSKAGGDMSGASAVVVGRSNIVGKPMAQLLLAADCTVTVAHSRTRDLPGVCRSADILIAAVGRPRMVEGDWIRPGATVIDVGINRIERPEGKTRLVGDVDFDTASTVAGAITPVPGGVGPMTIACLLNNTLIACCRQNGIDVPAAG